jgi:hypothetical protein
MDNGHGTSAMFSKLFWIMKICVDRLYGARIGFHPRMKPSRAFQKANSVAAFDERGNQVVT